MENLSRKTKSELIKLVQMLEMKVDRAAEELRKKTEEFEALEKIHKITEDQFLAEKNAREELQRKLDRLTFIPCSEHTENLKKASAKLWELIKESCKDHCPHHCREEACRNCWIGKELAAVKNMLETEI